MLCWVLSVKSKLDMVRLSVGQELTPMQASYMRSTSKASAILEPISATHEESDHENHKNTPLQCFCLRTASRALK
jgi:hypothetical protein